MKQRNECLKGHNMAITRKFYPDGDSYCSECKKIRYDDFRKSEIGKTKNFLYCKKSRIKRMYGITYEKYQELLKKQNGVCAICGKKPKDGKRGLHIDHDHDKNGVRGILCHSCNTALGLLGEDIIIISNMIQYLKKGKK